jgi:hypothetical protein
MIPQAGNAETDETGFCHYAGGHIRPTIRLQSQVCSTSLSYTAQQHPGEITMYRYLSCLIFLVATTTATAQKPIPRQGSSCPTGTYKSGDYCKPLKSAEDQVIIEKSGSKCPTGFYKSGNYCKRISSSDREAIPRDKGSKCPTGWRKSAGYCVEI